MLKHLSWNQIFICSILIYPCTNAFTLTIPSHLRNHELVKSRPSQQINSILYQKPHSTQLSLAPFDFDMLSSASTWVETASTFSFPSSLSSFSISAVDTFDGSTIVDTKIVSNAFWTRLQSNLLSVLLGQFFAVIVGGIALNFISTNAIQSFEKFSKKNFPFLMARESNENPPRVSPPIDPDFSKLIICLIIDIIGTSSELVPFIGELSDIIYAPIAAIAVRTIFPGSNLLFALEFIEEILPFTDIIPLATLCWIIETFYGTSDLARLLNIGTFSPTYNVRQQQQQQQQMQQNYRAGMDINGDSEAKVIKGNRDKNDAIDVSFSKEDDPNRLK